MNSPEQGLVSAHKVGRKTLALGCQGLTGARAEKPSFLALSAADKSV
ncbi:MAG: hypothetical protein V3R37_03785 [Rhodospirillales bacterium]